ARPWPRAEAGTMAGKPMAAADATVVRLMKDRREIVRRACESGSDMRNSSLIRAAFVLGHGGTHDESHHHFVGGRLTIANALIRVKPADGGHLRGVVVPGGEFDAGTLGHALEVL